MDLGAKTNIARSLQKRGCQVTIYPAFASAREILDDNPDGIMLSNGPGNPKECVSIIKEIRELYDSDVPIFAICLGHQLMALATGADTKKMKYGHRGLYLFPESRIHGGWRHTGSKRGGPGLYQCQ